MGRYFLRFINLFDVQEDRDCLLTESVTGVPQMSLNMFLDIILRFIIIIVTSPDGFHDVPGNYSYYFI